MKIQDLGFEIPSDLLLTLHHKLKKQCMKELTQNSLLKIPRRRQTEKMANVEEVDVWRMTMDHHLILDIVF